jgi:hypothetical protein
MKKEEDWAMAMYMVQFSYTVGGWRALMKNPEDRRNALEAAASAWRAKLNRSLPGTSCGPSDGI